METRSLLDHPRPSATPSSRPPFLRATHEGPSLSKEGHEEGAGKEALWFAVFLIAMGAAMRVARHFGVVHLPPNFAPVSALAMFSAVYLPKRMALVIPLVLMLLSDAFIGFDFWPITISIYACFFASSLIGQWLRSRVKWWTIGLGSLASSVLFFFVTNAAVWMFSKMYAKNLSGLFQSYVAGLPFFRNTMLGDLMYSGLFFGIYALGMVYYRSRKTVSTASLHG